MTFEAALEFVLRHEGGYVNDPVDRGGETNMGISKRSYPHLDIRKLTLEQAAECYRRDYWDKIRGDDLPWPVNLVVFDTAVNSGVTTAIKLLQGTVSASQDGIIGPKTLAAVDEYYPEESLARDYCWERMVYLARIVARDTRQTRFLNGWTKRVQALHKEIG